MERGAKPTHHQIPSNAQRASRQTSRWGVNERSRGQPLVYLFVHVFICLLLETGASVTNFGWG
jgi:hypothetical protein